MKSWHLIGLLCIATLFVGATINREQPGRYEYATLELRCAFGQFDANSRFDYQMTWRDSTQTLTADGNTKDKAIIPVQFFRELNLPFSGPTESRTLEHLLSQLGSQGWQIHTVQYSTDGTKRISSYLMMRKMQ